MESVRAADETAQACGNDTALTLEAGLEEYLTSPVILDLLKLPQDGLVRISAALFFLGDYEMFAFYWRDSYRGAEQHCKLVGADAVRSAFAPMPLDSGWLPLNAVRCGISREGERWLSIFVPPQIHPLAIQDNDFGLQHVAVPLPGLVFTGSGSSYWVWAVKGGAKDAIAYHAPLSNVSENGLICFGANRAPVASGTTIAQALSLFLTSSFNGHSASGKSRRHQGDIRFLLLDLAQQQAAYPLDDLCPITTLQGHALTLDTLYQNIQRR